MECLIHFLNFFRRNAFHITSYMLFFVNIFIGIFSALLRLSIGLYLGLFFFERAQKSLLPRWSERFDKGTIFYKQMLNKSFKSVCLMVVK